MLKRFMCAGVWVLLVAACPSKEAPAAPVPQANAAPAAAPQATKGLALWQPPTAVPSQLPLRTVKGLDALGFSNQVPDQVALLALLRGRHFEALTRFVEQIAQEVERDHHKELWMFAALGAFFQAAPDLGPALDEWVAANPSSFAPWSARARYFLAVAREADAESASQRAANRAFTERGAADLEKALGLRPTVVENVRWQTKIGIYLGAKGPRQPRAILDAGVRLCPDCFTIYQGVMVMLRPEWGGSLEAMDALAAEATRASKNPAMKLLAGESDLMRSRAAANDKRPADAAAACDRALRAGRWYPFLRERAAVAATMEPPEAWLPWVNEVLDQWPDDGAALGIRASALRSLGRWEEARNDILHALYVNPDDDVVKWERWQVMRALLKVAAVQYEAKDWKAAEDLYDQALRIQPDDAEPWFWRGMTFKKRGLHEQAFGDFKESVKHTRKWLVAYKELSAAYLKQEQGNEALTMWDGFIADNPEDAEALYVRGGVHNRLGNKERAMQDARRACELKFDKACAVLVEPGR